MSAFLAVELLKSERILFDMLGVNAYFFYIHKINGIVLAQVINQNQITFGQDTVWKLQPEK